MRVDEKKKSPMSQKLRGASVRERNGGNHKPSERPWLRAEDSLEFIANRGDGGRE